MASVWIQNAYHSDIAIDCKDKVTKQFMFRVVFSAVRVDRLTGRLQNDGYTELKMEQFEALCNNSMSFAKLLKDNKLIKYDKEPVTSMNSAERAVALQSKLAEANATIQKLEEQLGEANARIQELEAEKAASKEDTSVSVTGDATENPDGSVSAEGIEINDKPKAQKPAHKPAGKPNK